MIRPARSRRRLSTALVLVASAALAAPALAAAGLATATADAPLVPRSLASLATAPNALVEVSRGRDRAARPLLAAANGVEISHRLSIWRLPSAQARRLVPRLATAGLIREFEADAALEPAGGRLTSGDPWLPSEWWMNRVRADRVEPPGADRPAVPVTVIDSGLDVTHPEFAGRRRTTLLNEQTVKGPEESHGTAVSSLVAAPANGIGGVGMFPDADLYSFDVSPNGVLRTSALVAALDRAASLGRGVANLSLGAEIRSPLVEQVVLNAFDRGLVVVASAGNSRSEGSPNEYPANLPHVLTIAATDANDAVAAFSTESLGVDLAAPGADVPVAVIGGKSTYATGSGTSFSSPIVAGAAAWLWTARPELDKTQVMEILRRSARDIAAPGRDDDSGFGILDIEAALSLRAPVADPLEPNDDVTQIVGKGMFGHAKLALTTASRFRFELRARLDSYEDPEDVYRVWVGPSRQVTVKVAADSRVDVQLWKPGTTTVHARGWSREKYLAASDTRPDARSKTLTVANTGKSGAYYYVDAFMPAGAVLASASYNLTVATSTVKGKRT